jgi:hypothetical protein
MSRQIKHNLKEKEVFLSQDYWVVIRMLRDVEPIANNYEGIVLRAYE